MKAQLRIVRIELPLHRILPSGGTGQGAIGHSFDLLPTVKVDKRTFGVLSGEGIEVPMLEWNERIEWFEPVGVTIGARGANAPPTTWKYVGHLEKNMYKENPTSNTFKQWHSEKFSWAANSPPNTPSPALKAAAKGLDADKNAKHWIAANGCEWKIPGITDRPGMGLSGGSGGGGGESLVKTNSRRRVIYFNLGFAGHHERLKFVQVLESVNGVPTIHKFINKDVAKAQVDDANNLTRWRSQLLTPNNYAI